MTSLLLSLTHSPWGPIPEFGHSVLMANRSISISRRARSRTGPHEGDAFQGQPVEGDTVFARRPDMRSLHQGRYWIGTFERLGDKPIGTLTSVPFKVTHPWATFLVAGGQGPESRVELVDAATKTVFSKTHGDESETLKPVAVDLTQYMGKSIFIRLVDNGRDGWGHINFDNFLFHAEKPNVPQRVAAVPDDYKYAGQDPEVAARNMTVPPGFRVSLFAGEPDLHPADRLLFR
ncbi:MAG: hypothetical protein U0798_10400 [Gemmataceae bacterium]